MRSDGQFIPTLISTPGVTFEEVDLAEPPKVETVHEDDQANLSQCVGQFPTHHWRSQRRHVGTTYYDNLMLYVNLKWTKGNYHGCCFRLVHDLKDLICLHACDVEPDHWICPCFMRGSANDLTSSSSSCLPSRCLYAWQDLVLDQACLCEPASDLDGDLATIGKWSCTMRCCVDGIWNRVRIRGTTLPVGVLRLVVVLGGILMPRTATIVWWQRADISLWKGTTDDESAQWETVCGERVDRCKAVDKTTAFVSHVGHTVVCITIQHFLLLTQPQSHAQTITRRKQKPQIKLWVQQQ